MKLLVTGAAGFIGSTYVRTVLAGRADGRVVLDKLTYAGRKENLQDVEHTFMQGAIEDPDAVAGAIDGVDAVVLVTEWPEFGALDLSEVARRMRGSVVVDGRNFFDPDAVRAAGLTYEGIGRPSAEAGAVEPAAVMDAGAHPGGR